MLARTPRTPRPISFSLACTVSRAPARCVDPSPRGCAALCPPPLFPQLQFVYKPPVEGQPPTPSLHDRLLQLFSYAHGGGFEMDPTAALAEEAAAGAGAAAGAHA